MYELCMNCKKYNEAKTKLDKFQEQLTEVRFNFLLTSLHRLSPYYNVIAI